LLIAFRVKGFRMSRPVICVALLSAICVLDVGKADAQLLQRIRQRRAAALIPPVDPNAPVPAVDPAVPPVEPPIAGGFFARRLQRRRDLVAQQAAEAQPTPASPALPPQQLGGQAPAFAQRQTVQALRQASAIAAPALRALTQSELSRMEVSTLQTALSNTSGALSNDLNRYTSAESWQGFLKLPSGIVEEGTIDVATLQTMLVRFENVALNPRFAQIASLPSFHQARSILAELVNRADASQAEDPQVAVARMEAPQADGPRLIDPVGATELSAETEPLEETLPAPTPQPPLPRNDGEHSILLRTDKG
jgi:hypothetical protein